VGAGSEASSPLFLAVGVRAYRLQFYQISGPKWPGTEYYDIVANVPDGATDEDLRLMLQALLSERFHLAVHHETKTIQAYQLVVARSSPKLTVANLDPAASNTKAPAVGPNFVAPTKSGIYMKTEHVGDEQGIYPTVKTQTLSDIAKFLTRQMGAPVSDNTGLQEKYDFTLAYVPIADETFGVSSLPYPPTALEKDLGLKLIAEKTDIDTLVIDHIDINPTQN